MKQYAEIKGLDDRLTVIAILAKNGHVVRQKKIEQIVNGKKAISAVVEFEKPEDPFISFGRRDDD